MDKEENGGIVDCRLPLELKNCLSLNFCLFVFPFVCPPFYLSLVCLSFRLSDWLSAYLLVCLPICLSAYLSVCLPACLPVCLPVVAA
jgi:hypothetical protein